MSQLILGPHVHKASVSKGTKSLVSKIQLAISLDISRWLPLTFKKWNLRNIFVKLIFLLAHLSAFIKLREMAPLKALTNYFLSSKFPTSKTLEFLSWIIYLLCIVFTHIFMCRTCLKNRNYLFWRKDEGRYNCGHKKSANMSLIQRYDKGTLALYTRNVIYSAIRSGGRGPAVKKLLIKEG